MQRKAKTGFWRSDSAATAALYALALPALVAVAGLGFDYARIASMDTELQNAADQAALAGATQLDQSAGSMQRAVNAARGGLVSNSTLFANDGAGTTVTVPDTNVYFYETRDQAEAGGPGLFRAPDGFGEDPNDAKAKYIRVAVATRTADYALTSVVGAFSGDIDAEAVAGIGAALCRTPPLMICNPTEPAENLDKNIDFDTKAYKGLGLLAKDGGGGKWTPGNFGYLNTFGTNGFSDTDLRSVLSWDAPPGDCVSKSANATIDTATGNHAGATASINTRFDIYEGNLSTVCPGTGKCPASLNSVKDVFRPAAAAKGDGCDVGKDDWHELSSGTYLPDTLVPITTTPKAMGHPRDICHSTPTLQCAGGRFGNGVWDWDAYFRTNYGATWNWRALTASDLPINAARNGPTRYDVYTWEMANRGKTIGGVTVLGPRTVTNPTNGSNTEQVTSYGSPQCSASKGYTPTEPSQLIADRRRISVAVVNCNANDVRGSSKGVPARRFIDVFLVQPSLDRESKRTTKDEIYIEIIGETQSGSAGETAGTVIRRDVPYLIK
jgi:hypothetical protein